MVQKVFCMRAGMNQCKLAENDTKEFGNMLKRIHIFEEGRVLDRRAKDCTVEGSEVQTHHKSVQNVNRRIRSWRLFNGAERFVEFFFIKDQDVE